MMMQACWQRECVYLIMLFDLGLHKVDETFESCLDVEFCGLQVNVNLVKLVASLLV